MREPTAIRPPSQISHKSGEDLFIGAPRYYLTLTAFVSGVVSLALELSAGRLLAPAFGTTEIVWSAIIGLIMLYLSAGYMIGGKWADKSPHPSTLYTILVGAGCFIALIPIGSRPLLKLAVEGMRVWDLGLLAGPFVVILGLFAVPVTLLASISPFIIRLSMHNVSTSGGTSGRIYAISTAGSFIGTFLPNLVLIPNLGTWRTFIVLAAVCVLTGLGGLWSVHRKRFWALILMLPLLVLLFIAKPVTLKNQEGLLFEGESTYNFIQVVEDTSQRRYLLLNEGQGIHSIYTPPSQYASPDNADRLLTYGPWDNFLIAPFFNTAPFFPTDVKNMLIIGLAAGTTSTQATMIFGPLPIDGIEIDPMIVETGRKYFDMNQRNLIVHITDGMTFLDTTQSQYSLIVIDSYRLPYIPWHLTTVEFFHQVYDHLDDTGVIAINVGHTVEDWRLVDGIANTMRKVYTTVHIINIEGSLNAVLVGTLRPTNETNLTENLSHIEDNRLLSIAEKAIPNLRSPGFSALVFTDDHAPIEQISHEVALQYILGSDTNR
ncbi:MAG: spermine synthase [Anaerolineales bacterium]|nr:MAG: spermine synthase [Anaerolineales bacterium]